MKQDLSKRVLVVVSVGVEDSVLVRRRTNQVLLLLRVDVDQEDFLFAAGSGAVVSHGQPEEQQKSVRGIRVS